MNLLLNEAIDHTHRMQDEDGLLPPAVTAFAECTIDWSSVPPPVSSMCSAMAEYFDVPSEWPLLSAGTIAAGLAGNKAKWPGIHGGLLIVAGASPVTGLARMLRTLHEPVEIIQGAISRTLREQEAMSGDPGPLISALHGIKGYDRPAGRPLILADSLLSKDLERALEYAYGDSLVVFDPQADDLLHRSRREIDLVLAARSLAGQKVTFFRKNKQPLAVSPFIAATLAGSYSFLRWFVAGYERLPSHLRDAVIFLDGSLLQGNRPPRDRTRLGSACSFWIKHLSKIWERRLSASEPLVLKASEEAHFCLSEFQAEWADLVEDINPVILDQLPDLRSLAERICWSLQLLQPEGHQNTISEATAKLAISLAKKYFLRPPVQQVPRPVRDGVPVDRWADIILERITVRGPMRLRELIRTFDQQRVSDYEPAIRTLIEKQLLVHDDSGRLAPGPRLTAALLPQDSTRPDTRISDQQSTSSGGNHDQSSPL